MSFSKLLPHGSLRRKWIHKHFIDAPPPPHISRNFREIEGVPGEINLEEEEIGDTYAGRVWIARRYVVPWLDRARRLEGCRLLEIGCGAGASTVTFAEQGCRVTAVDVDGPAVDRARERCEKLGHEVEFVVANSTDVPRLLGGQKFDFIVFYASMEHMTHQERIAAIRGTWEMLAPGDFWCITGTPNRLWYYDFHTAYLPFYFWLPDDLAFAYAQRSKRTGFRELYDEPTAEKMHHFLRRGRGVSYHEFDLAIRPVATLDIVSSMGPELREQRLFNKWRWKFTRDFAYESFLQRAAPDIHRGFYQKFLNLLIRKD
jgi:S-adenosylmethionine-dependent methyltransferase